MRHRGRPRGSIAQVIFFMVLVLAMLVVSAIGTIFQLNLNRQDEAEDGARRLAEAAVQVAVARILKQPDLDGSGLPTIELELESYSGGQGLLALDETEAANLGIPKSVNNLMGGGSVSGWDDTIVAQQTANLVGVGRFMGREKRVEVVLHRPKFPYVVSSSVPVEAVDGLNVFGVNDPAALASGFTAIPPEMREPGHIVTNSEDQSGPSMKLRGSTTLIEGDAQSRGTVSVGSGAQVLGEQRPEADLAPIPDVDLSALDTASRPGVNEIAPGAYGATTLTGFNRTSGGDLTISGGVTLDGGVLFVDGGVTVNGGLSGNGAIIATGPIQVTGGGALTGASGTALLSEGGITLEGTSSQRAEFRGLLYTQGNLSSLHTNIAGSVVVNNPDPSGSVVLEQVTMVESQELAVVSFPVMTTLPGTPAGIDETMVTTHTTDYGTLFGISEIPDAPNSAGTATAPMILDANYNGPNFDYTDPPDGFEITHYPTAAEPYYQIGLPNPMPADPLNLGAVRICNLDPNAPWDELSGDYGYQTAHSPDYTDSAQAEQALADAAAAWGSPDPAGAASQWMQEAETIFVNEKLPEFVDKFNQNAIALSQVDENTVYTPGSDPITIITPWELDLSQFYNLAEGIRILSWRELP